MLMATGHGGRRNGAGRKTGAAQRVSRETANVLMADGEVLPLHVVMKAMRVHYAEARSVDQTGKEVWDLDKLKEAAVLADRALPYCHARIAPIDQAAIPPTGDLDEENTLEDARRVAFLLTVGAREAEKVKALPKPKKRK